MNNINQALQGPLSKLVGQAKEANSPDSMEFVAGVEELMENKKEKAIKLDASNVIMWLDGEIDRLEYPVGSLDISRSERDRVAKHARSARLCLKYLQAVGR